ncbi:MAG: hypothetical protein CL693_01940 [Cellvibrionaceae bacterium]|nr:hypothetical protein [Cellvibrionaceae bacterium]
MSSIHSLHSVGNLHNTIQSRTAVAKEEGSQSNRALSDQRLKSSDTPQEDSVSSTLSTRKDEANSDGKPQTYAHLEKSLSAQQLDLSDIRGSLSQLRDHMDNATSFKGTHREEGAAGQFAIPQIDNTAADKGKLFSLMVTTADGDRVEIEISKTHGTEGKLAEGGYSYSETSVSVKIDGELDAAEFEALTELTDKLAGLADTYRKEDWAQIGDFSAFSHEELSGFNLNVLGVDGNSFSLDYKVDVNSGERTISSDLNGYNFDIRVDIDGLKLDENVANNQQYLQYQQLIRDTAYSYKQGEDAGGVSSSKAASFFVQGMDAIFDVDEDEKDAIDQRFSAQDSVEELGGLDRMNSGNQQLLDSFSSGLADFEASFNTPIFRPNEYQQSEVSTMSLDIAQITEISRHRDQNHSYTDINQRSEYQSRVSQHLGVGGDSVEHANLDPEANGGQSYLYRTDIKSASIDRSLSFEDTNKLIAIDEQRSQQHIQKDKTVIGGKLESNTVKDLSAAYKNADTHVDIVRTTQEQQAQQILKDYRSIEQMDALVDGSQVELFI